MLDGIEVNVIDVPFKICFIANGMFPELTLPERDFAILEVRDRVFLPYISGSCAEPTFHQMPPVWKNSISRRQFRYNMEVIGQHRYCVDHEWALSPGSRNRRA